MDKKARSSDRRKISVLMSLREAQVDTALLVLEILLSELKAGRPKLDALVEEQRARGSWDTITPYCGLH